MTGSVSDINLGISRRLQVVRALKANTAFLLLQSLMEMLGFSAGPRRLIACLSFSWRENGCISVQQRLRGKPFWRGVLAMAELCCSSSWRCGHDASGRNASRPQPRSNTLFSCSVMFKEPRSDRHNKHAHFYSRWPPYWCAATSTRCRSDYSPSLNTSQNVSEHKPHYN